MLTIAAVHPGSPGEALGLVPGDALISVAGQSVRDVIDVHFYSSGAGETLDLVAQQGGTERFFADVQLGAEGLGLEFAAPTDDGVRSCNNRCVFCFIDQLPTHMRRSLYFKDDDFRYSFLSAYFVTLTNLGAADWRKIEEQHLSPLYVSVHATDLELRRKMLGNPKAPDILSQLDRLGSIGIRCHAQVVLCPGFNDGVALDQTIDELATRWPAVQSVAVVPVGITRQRREQQENLLLHDSDAARLRGLTAEEAGDLIRWARPLQRSFRNRIGHTFLYLSDEIYLLAERPVPLAVRYDDYQQRENGVGMVRTLLTQWRRSKHRLPDALPKPVKATLVCATLIAPTLQRIAQEMRLVRQLDVRIAVADNRFFGATVTVSGLLTARDMLAAAGEQTPDDLLFVPRAALDPSTGQEFLDGMSLTEFREATPAKVVIVATVDAVVTAITKELGLPRHRTKKAKRR
ncbi:MAG: Fe-S oxidoreductase [Dehalococcoidia bacterium]|nr:Fe-S oxidoreductase [Dehalococcoidia bacterium]